jgi:Ni,Fe-hydrogenase III small subunit/NAD-dependent dihydropyrimidine dehydrogenase PreA subunit
MLKALRQRIAQGHRTIAFPRALPALPDRFRGRPEIDAARCAGDACAECVRACPTSAISVTPGCATLDLGRCVFCGDCVEACPEGAIRFTGDWRMATRGRDDLRLSGRTLRLAEALDHRARRLFGRALRLRQVSAGGCNACEADTNVLNTIGFDLGRFGVQFVASPRHADGVLITGPVSANMDLALRKTIEAVPEPRLVIAVGACAISGGPYAGHPEAHDGVPPDVAVDLYVPGCPPHPITILDGILRLLGRFELPAPNL